MSARTKQGGRVDEAMTIEEKCKVIQENRDYWYGVAEEYRQKLFDAEAALAQNAQGEAVGEYVANIDKHGGVIWRAGPPPHGSKLYTNAERARVPEHPLPMDTAPRDGTMLRLLVQFDEHATEDTAAPAWTIGANEFDANGNDEWRFAGWCWTHDHFTEGKGTPVGWLPMLAAAPSQPDTTGETP